MNETPGTQLLHWSEGRVRLKNPVLRNAPDLAHRIESTLCNAIGIRTAKANATTASLLVEYDASAWRDSEATRRLWAVLCGLFPGNCSIQDLEIPVGEFSRHPAVRDAVMRAFEPAQGVTEVRYESTSDTVHVQFDPQRFALEPVVRSLTERVARIG